VPTLIIYFARFEPIRQHVSDVTIARTVPVLWKICI